MRCEMIATPLIASHIYLKKLMLLKQIFCYLCRTLPTTSNYSFSLPYLKYKRAKHVGPTAAQFDECTGASIRCERADHAISQHP